MNVPPIRLELNLRLVASAVFTVVLYCNAFVMFSKTNRQTNCRINAKKATATQFSLGRSGVVAVISQIGVSKSLKIFLHSGSTVLHILISFGEKYFNLPLGQVLTVGSHQLW